MQKNAHLDDLELRYGVDHSRLQLDEKVEFTLLANVPDDIIVRFEAVGDTLGSFAVKARYPKGPTPLADGRNRWQRRYILTPTAMSNAKIPSLSVTFFTEEFPVLHPPCNTDRDCVNARHRRVPPEMRLAATQRELCSSALTLIVC